jgi:hypothetical protein
MFDVLCPAALSFHKFIIFKHAQIHNKHAPLPCQGGVGRLLSTKHVLSFSPPYGAIIGLRLPAKGNTLILSGTQKVTRIPHLCSFPLPSFVNLQEIPSPIKSCPYINPRSHILTFQTGTALIMSPQVNGNGYVNGYGHHNKGTFLFTVCLFSDGPSNVYGR